MECQKNPLPSWKAQWGQFCYDFPEVTTDQADGVCRHVASFEVLEQASKMMLDSLEQFSVLDNMDSKQVSSNPDVVWQETCQNTEYWSAV